MSTKFRCFEDYHVGEEGVTSSRTIGETAIDTFAYVTGDYSREHVDRHSAAESPYGVRVAHGLLGASLAVGMISQTAPQIVGRDVPGAFLRGFEANYRRPIRIDDTIRIHWRVSGMADDPLSGRFGIVETNFRIVNQDDLELYDGTLATRVARESAGDVSGLFRPGIPWEIKRFVLDPTRLYCLEDYVIGEGEETRGRTMTEADVVNFTGLTGDSNPLHVDAEYAKASVFGERIVPAMLVFSTGFLLVRRDAEILAVRTHPGTVSWAGHLGDGATFLAPVRIGDTLRCRCRIESLRASKSKPGLGILRLGLQMINQRNEVTQEGHVSLTRGTRNR